MTSARSLAMPNNSPWRNVALDVDPDQIMAALERGFPVRLIGTFGKKLVTCQINDSLADVVTRPDTDEFDFLPVTEGDKIVGLLDRRAVRLNKVSTSKHSQKLVRDRFNQLDHSNIIAADAGILVFLLNAKASPCRLILTGDSINGLVSKSDLQKLPVRALLFHFVTHLELAMAAWIQKHFADNDEEWLAALSRPRRKSVEERYDDFVKANLAIDLVTATMFCDKRTVILKFGDMPKDRCFEAEKELKRIEKLRDIISHSGDYARTARNADEMIETVAWARLWIESLSNLLPKPKT